jgi:hypothetical protein
VGISSKIQHRKENKMIKLELTVEEVNTILRSLGKHPFDEIAQLIVKIKQQGDPQAVAQNQAADAPEAPAA